MFSGPPYETELIAFWSGPGCGKSQLMAATFAALKARNICCEMATEFAKELTWQGRKEELKYQLYIAGKQSKRVESLWSKTKYIITDSPLALAAIYSPPHYPNSFRDCILYIYKQYKPCHNFFLPRQKLYNPNGRNQTEEEAAQLDKDIFFLLNSEAIPFTEIPRDVDRVEFVLKTLNLGD